MTSKYGIYLLIQRTSKYLNIPAPDVFYVTKNGKPIDYMAKYDGNIDVIFINEDWMKEAPFEFVYEACLHEIRHAYQNLCITKNIIEDEETLKIWRHNALYYIEPNPNLSFEMNLGYIMQPLELDADAFAYFYIYQLFKIDLSLMKLIEKPVLEYANKKFFSKIN